MTSGLNVSGSRELALRSPERRPALIANLLGQRLWLTPIALLLIFAFALLAGYPRAMVIGTLLAGSGLYLVCIADALLLRLTVELRNAGLGFVDFLRAGCDARGGGAAGRARRPPDAVLRGPDRRRPGGPGGDAAAGGRGAFVLPRLDRSEQRLLLTGRCRWRRRWCWGRSTSAS